MKGGGAAVTRKDWRRVRWVLAVAALSTAALMIYLSLQRQMPVPEKEVANWVAMKIAVWLQPILLIITMAVSLYQIWTSESADNTLGYLRTLPVSRSSVWLRKTGMTLMTMAIFTILGILTALFLVSAEMMNGRVYYALDASHAPKPFFLAAMANLYDQEFLSTLLIALPFLQFFAVMSVALLYWDKIFLFTRRDPRKRLKFFHWDEGSYRSIYLVGVIGLMITLSSYSAQNILPPLFVVAVMIFFFPANIALSYRTFTQLHRTAAQRRRFQLLFVSTPVALAFLLGIYGYLGVGSTSADFRNNGFSMIDPWLHDRYVVTFGEFLDANEADEQANSAEAFRNALYHLRHEDLSRLAVEFSSHLDNADSCDSLALLSALAYVAPRNDALTKYLIDGDKPIHLSTFYFESQFYNQFAYNPTASIFIQRSGESEICRWSVHDFSEALAQLAEPETVQRLMKTFIRSDDYTLRVLAVLLMRFYPEPAAGEAPELAEMVIDSLARACDLYYSRGYPMNAVEYANIHDITLQMLTFESSEGVGEIEFRSRKRRPSNTQNLDPFGYGALPKEMFYDCPAEIANAVSLWRDRLSKIRMEPKSLLDKINQAVADARLTSARLPSLNDPDADFFEGLHGFTVYEDMAEPSRLALCHYNLQWRKSLRWPNLRQAVPYTWIAGFQKSNQEGFAVQIENFDCDSLLQNRGQRMD